MSQTISGWRMTGPKTLVKFDVEAAAPKASWVRVKVAGCGVCHTDIGYLYDGVPTKHPLPLTLGHEISGVVEAAGAGAEQWLGRRVIVPSVTPCGECDLCKEGHVTACRKSLMPGNDHDGGFATHVDVPAHGLCAVDEKPAKDLDAPLGKAGLQLWELSVLADAITTPLQAIRRSQLRAKDVAVVVGAGGVGSYGVQIAKALGATVVALDVDAGKLDRAKALGADQVFDARTPPKELKKSIAALAKQTGARGEAWRVYEMSGSKPGQELAWSLLTQNGCLSVVGYTPEAATVRLSNLMAFDATAYGNWGCDPALYPECLAMVLDGKVKIRGLVRKESLAETPKILEAVHHHAFAERVVLVP